MADTYTDLLKLRMPALGDIGWDDEVNDNQMIAEFVLGSLLKSNVVISGLAVTDGGGLSIDVTGGDVVVGGASFTLSADTKSLYSGIKNWIYVDDAGALQVGTTQPIGNYVALAMIDVGTSTITRIADARNFAEGALTIGVTYSPANYTPDTGQTGAINQHLAGVDEYLGRLGAGNLLINPKFEINQRAFVDGALAAGVYGYDRWKGGASGATIALSGDTLTISAGSIIQPIEDVNIPDGTYTVSWSGTAQVKVDGGTAENSPYTFVISSGTHVAIEFTAGTLQAPKVEAGSITTPFIARPIDIETTLANRYFEKIYAASTDSQICTAQATSAGSAIGSIPYREKRVVPTTTISNIGDDFTVSNSVGSRAFIDSASVINCDLQYATIEFDRSSYFSAGNAVRVDVRHGYLFIDAEL